MSPFCSEIAIYSRVGAVVGQPCSAEFVEYMHIISSAHDDGDRDVAKAMP